jgi:exopolyphosphatase/guanosine-5'-triphosphate,3'-diphosphate pyrophosphatase
VFAGGLAALAGVFDALALEKMETSERALREGVIYDLLGRLSNHDVRDESVNAMARRYAVDLKHAEAVQRTALKILEQTGKSLNLEPKFCAMFLGWAARLHEIGLAISHSAYHKHGEYIIKHCDLQGFSQTDQKLLAALVRVHRGKFAMLTFDDLPSLWVEPLRQLTMIFRLAVLLHRSRTPDLRPPVKVSANRRLVDISFSQKTWLARHPLTQTDLEREAEYLNAIGVRLKVS